MKEILDAIFTRLKSPFLGSTLIIYIIFNIKTIAIFFIEDKEKKLEMLENYHIDMSLLIICVVMAFSYIIFSDWLQVIVDLLVTKAKEKRKIILFDSRARIANKEYISTPEYRRALAERELDEWVSDRDKKKKEIEELREKLTKSEKDHQDKLKEIEELNNRVTEYEKIVDKHKSKRGMFHDKLYKIAELLHSVGEPYRANTLKDGTPYYGVLRELDKKAKDNELEIIINELESASELVSELLGDLNGKYNPDA